MLETRPEGGAGFAKIGGMAEESRHPRHSRASGGGPKGAPPEPRPWSTKPTRAVIPSQGVAYGFCREQTETESGSS